MKILLGFGTFLIVLLLGYTTISYYTPDISTVKVNDAVRECKGLVSSECRYVVYTDAGVFENKDSFLFFKFNSSDLHNTLLGMKGKEVKIKSNGFRIPFLSSYRNIIEVVE
jgi:hypothetical protein